MIKYDGRIGWDEVFMAITKIFSLRSACNYYKVGVVFVRSNRILCAGYNGPPRDEPHCVEVGCAKEDENGNRLPAGSGLCRGAHAEMNAIANASTEGVMLDGATVYCTYSPCYDCAKILVNLGIRTFIYEMEYQEEEGRRAIELLRRRGIEVRQFVSVVLKTKFNDKEVKI